MRKFQPERLGFVACNIAELTYSLRKFVQYRYKAFLKTCPSNIVTNAFRQNFFAHAFVKFLTKWSHKMIQFSVKFLKPFVSLHFEHSSEVVFHQSGQINNVL